jgi:hypothetical protein
MTRSSFHVALLLIAGCSSSSTTDDARASTASATETACSTGPAYVFETEFPAIASVDSSLPECVPRCENGDARSGYGMARNAWLLSALPSGACANDAEACQMGAVRSRTCPSGETSMCSFTGYECRCEAGNWRCYSGPPGASACTCP